MLYFLADATLRNLQQSRYLGRGKGERGQLRF
jgi:hypothetical protein